MKFALLALSFCALVFSAIPAFAQACYQPAEAEAEQGIRIHSELMVIALNCQHIQTANGQNLYTAYREFTQRNIDIFANYEKILIDYFTRDGSNEPIARLNSLRTNFANKISNDAAMMRPDMFCQRYAPRIIKAQGMNQDELHKWAGTVYPSHPVSVPLCQQGNIGIQLGH